MKLSEYEVNLGKIATINEPDGLTVQVKILDVKNVYGCIRYKVKPVAGAGEVWVNENRVRMP